jgi:hypothetical protein
MRGRENNGPETDRWQRKDWWGVQIDAVDGPGLLRFYSALLDRPIHHVDESGGTLDFGEGVAYLAVQMMVHLDVEVSDLASAVEHAVELGATTAGFQPQDDVRVMLDPEGHPFCLYS